MLVVDDSSRDLQHFSGFLNIVGLGHVVLVLKAKKGYACGNTVEKVRLRIVVFE